MSVTVSTSSELPLIHVQSDHWRWRTRLGCDILEFPLGIGAPLLSWCLFWLMLLLKVDGAWSDLSYWAVFCPLMVLPIMILVHVLRVFCNRGHAELIRNQNTGPGLLLRLR